MPIDSPSLLLLLQPKFIDGKNAPRLVVFHEISSNRQFCLSTIPTIGYAKEIAMVQLNQKQIQLFVIRPGKRIDQERSEGRFYALRRLRMEEFLALVAAE